jgi:hypothetical protein
MANVPATTSSYSERGAERAAAEESQERRSGVSRENGFLMFESPVPLLSFPRAALSPPRPRSYSLAPPLLRSARSPSLTAARSR